eukprot:TRINITY_DN12136_c0_g1_i2.p1 TRINITY_DN12136_c0_g1~~TRINITY_DN12136_c0_g1_i2.p1  ORF type:complete len:267 (+),score=51.51 TRINITY_DN12136_c0_g1_i2:80-802(+)
MAPKVAAAAVDTERGSPRSSPLSLGHSRPPSLESESGGGSPRPCGGPCRAGGISGVSPALNPAAAPWRPGGVSEAAAPAVSEQPPARQPCPACAPLIQQQAAQIERQQQQIERQALMLARQAEELERYHAGAAPVAARRSRRRPAGPAAPAPSAAADSVAAASTSAPITNPAAAASSPALATLTSADGGHGAGAAAAAASFDPTDLPALLRLSRAEGRAAVAGRPPRPGIAQCYAALLAE